MCVNHRSDTFTSVHWGIYVNHSLCDITNGEAYLKQADGAECWFKLLFLNYHCSQAHFKKKETWSGPDFWWEPRVLHSRSRSLQACWWSAEPTRWKGNDKRAKKTHPWGSLWFQGQRRRNLFYSTRSGLPVRKRRGFAAFLFCIFT